MLSYRVLRHAILMVVNNLGEVFRLSAPMLAVAILAPLVMIATFGIDQANLPEIDGEIAQNGGVAHVAGLGYFMMLLVRIAVTMWVLVAWHRYVLLQQKPRGPVMRVPVDRVIAYAGTTFLVVLAAMAGVLCIVVPANIIAAVTGGSETGMVAAFILSVLALLLFYPVVLRLSVALPAAAIGHPLGLGGAWHATRGQTVTCIGILVLGVLAGIIASIPLILLAYVLPASIYIVVNAVFGVLYAIIGASVLTTLYGHFVEDRDLL